MPDPAPHLPVEALLEHGTFLRALARGLLGDEDRAEDAVQDAYRSALEHPPRIDSAPGTGTHRSATRSWLATVVQNHARNILRGEVRRADRERLAARAESAQDDVADRLRTQRRVMGAVEALREPYRTVVFLRYAEGLPPREIARRTGAPVETVRSQVQRGLELLRRDLDREYGDRASWCAAIVPLAAPHARFATATAVPFVAWLALVAVIAAIPIGIGYTLRDRVDPLAALPAVEPWSSFTASATEIARASGLSARRALATPERARRTEPPAAAAPAGTVAVLVVDAGGEPLGGVRFADSTPTAEDGWTRVPTGAREPVDAGSGAHLHVLSETTRADGSTEFSLDVPATFELEGDPEELARAELWLASDDGRIAATARAHAGTRPFVRFTRVPARTLLEGGGGAAWILGASSDDGARHASTRVHAVRGRAAEAVALRFEAASRAVLRVASASGVALEDVRFESSARVRPSGEPGSWILESRAAQCEITVRARGHVPELSSFPATPRTMEPWEIRLEPRPGHALEIELSSASGRPDMAVEFEIRHASTPLESRTVRATRSPDGRARASVTDLGVGTYTVIPLDGGPWPFDPPAARVQVPGAPVQFVRRDGPQPRSVTVRARDAEGRPLARVRCALLVDRHELGKRAAVAEQPRIPVHELEHGGVIPAAVIPGQRFWWLVEADGCTSVHGDEGDLRRAGDGLEIDVRLEPGWRCELWFAGLDAHGSPHALADVRLTTRAGRELAASLADGRIVLELPYDPGQLRIERAGWNVVAWEGFANGKRRVELPVHRVLFERDP